MSGKFSQIKNQLVVSELSDNAFRVICYLISCSKNSLSFPSIRTIAQRLNKGKDTVNRAIKELEQKGILLKENRILGTGRKTSNAYYINEEYVVTKKEKQQVIQQLDDEIKESVEKVELFDYNWLDEEEVNDN